MPEASAERMLEDAPAPWSVELGHGLHALVDGNGKLVARSPMLAWLEAIAAVVNEFASQQARAPNLLGPIQELDAGRYRAVVLDGVPVVKRVDTVGAMYQVLVPCSPEIVAELSADWSEPAQFRIEAGELVFRRVA